MLPADAPPPGYTDLVRAGSGGVGDVYRSTRVVDGVEVAVKVVRDVTDRSAAGRRFRRELTALVALGGQPHVVDLLDVVSVGEHPALVMPWMRRGSLADLVERRGGGLTAGETIGVAHQIASALAAAHARGIVHRDVKPHNVLVAESGSVAVCDFGTAALARSPEMREATAAVSLRYASPEDLEDDGEVGPASDVYSLGATLLFLAHGVNLDVRDRFAAWQPSPAHDGARGDPAVAALDALIGDCLRPAAAERPDTDALVTRLARLDHDHGCPIGPDLPYRPDVTAARRAARAEPPMGSLVRPAAVGRRVASAPTRRRSGRTEGRAPAHRLVDRFRVGVSVIVAIGGAIGAGLLVATVLRGDSTPLAPEPPRRVIARPSGLVDLAAVGWPSGPAGECLVQEPGGPILERVTCAEPHDLQRVGAGRLPSAPNAPADATVDAACATAARRYLGSAPAGLGLAIAVSSPSPAGWSLGDRDFQCFVGMPDARLTGDAAVG